MALDIYTLNKDTLCTLYKMNRALEVAHLVIYIYLIGQSKCFIINCLIPHRLIIQAISPVNEKINA